MPPQGTQPPADLPVRIGPVELDTLGAMVAVRCPRELDPLLRQAGGVGAGRLQGRSHGAAAAGQRSGPGNRRQSAGNPGWLRPPSPH
jgi:hypothetical protein